MGYTHYFYRTPELDKSKFKAAVSDIRKVVALLPSVNPQEAQMCYPNGDDTDVKLAGWDGEVGTKPKFTDELVSFNGVGADAHETFLIAQTFEAPDYRPDPDEEGLHFAFCKTARKPYDIAVTASLAVLKHHLGDAIRVSSDGDFDEWADGLALAGEATSLDLSALMQTELERDE